MRLFVGVFLPPGLQEKVWSVGDIVDGRWKREEREKLHITLKFIGEVSENRFREIEEILRDVRISPFEVELKGVGTFPERGNPRVIWVGVHGEGIVDLQREVEEKLASVGVPREWRPFVPHVTLGRVKGDVDLTRFFQRYRETIFGRFTINHFSLVQSRLTPEGSIYRVLRRYDL